MINKSNFVALLANVQDRLIYAARRYKISNLQNQAVLEFGGILNASRLAQAVRLSIDTQPVLGSRFISQRRRPYWQKFTELDSIKWFSLEETNNQKKVINRFLTTPLDIDNEQQIQVKLIRSRGNDILCIKISHACCDGGSLKAYQHTLAEIYTELGGGQDYTQKLNACKRIDPGMFFRKLGLISLMKVMDFGQNPLQSTWAFPFCHSEPEKQQLAIRRLSGRYLELLYNYAKKRGASINDLILTAYYRALFEVIAPPPRRPKEILITVDLRRYLQDDQANTINNLSSAVLTRISRQPGEPFEETLARVTAATSIIKRNSPGIQVAVLFGLLSLFSYEQNLNFVRNIKKWLTITGNCSPILSNVGKISPSIIWFGKTPVIDAYQVSPAIYAPGFMLGVCTYNNNLTFTVSYYEPSTPGEKVEQFLDIMLQELASITFSQT